MKVIMIASKVITALKTTDKVFWSVLVVLAEMRLLGSALKDAIAHRYHRLTRQAL